MTTSQVPCPSKWELPKISGPSIGPRQKSSYYKPMKRTRNFWKQPYHISSKPCLRSPLGPWKQPSRPETAGPPPESAAYYDPTRSRLQNQTRLLMASATTCNWAYGRTSNPLYWTYTYTNMYMCKYIHIYIYISLSL